LAHRYVLAILLHRNFIEDSGTELVSTPSVGGKVPSRSDERKPDSAAEAGAIITTATAAERGNRDRSAPQSDGAAIGPDVHRLTARWGRTLRDESEPGTARYRERFSGRGDGPPTATESIIKPRRAMRGHWKKSGGGGR